MGAESEAQVVCMSKRPVCSHHWEGAKLLLVNPNDEGSGSDYSAQVTTVSVLCPTQGLVSTLIPVITETRGPERGLVSDSPRIGPQLEIQQ